MHPQVRPACGSPGGGDGRLRAGQRARARAGAHHRHPAPPSLPLTVHPHPPAPPRSYMADTAAQIAASAPDCMSLKVGARGPGGWGAAGTGRSPRVGGARESRLRPANLPLARPLLAARRRCWRRASARRWAWGCTWGWPRPRPSRPSSSTCRTSRRVRAALPLRCAAPAPMRGQPPLPVPLVPCPHPRSSAHRPCPAPALPPIPAARRGQAAGGHRGQGADL